MKRLVTVGTIMLAALALLFAGCSKKAETGAGAAKSVVRIVTWTNPASVEAIKAASVKFSQKYPDITVEVTDIESNQVDGLIRTRMAANDVEIISHQGGLTRAQVDWAPGPKPTWQEMVDNGNYLDISGEPWVKNWTTGAANASYNGKVWGISVGSTVVTGVFYNKKTFADNGWSVPATWADFEKLCAAIKAKGMTPMTVGGADGWPYTMLMNDIVASVEPDHAGLAKALWTGERRFDDAQSLEIFRRGEFLNQNFENSFKSIPYSAAPGRFVAGRAVMMPDGNWNVTEVLKADPNFPVGYFPMPGNTPGLQYQGKSDLSFHINARSPNKDSAVKWLEFLSDKAVYTEFINIIGFIPTMEGVTITNKFLSEEILPKVTNMKPLWELNYLAPSGVGQYAGYSAYQYLKSAGGPVATVQELARLSQKDFEDGTSAALKNQ